MSLELHVLAIWSMTGRPSNILSADQYDAASCCWLGLELTAPASSSRNINQSSYELVSPFGTNGIFAIKDDVDDMARLSHANDKVTDGTADYPIFLLTCQLGSLLRCSLSRCGRIGVVMRGQPSVVEQSS